MNDYDSYARAQATLAAAERGEYDHALGIDPARRALLTKAADPEQHLTPGDVSALSAFGEYEAIVAADDAGRIQHATTPTTKELT